MLKDRVITALVLLAIFFLTLIAHSPVYFGAFTLLFVVVAAWEWGRLSGYFEGARCALALTVMLMCSFLWCTGWGEKISAMTWLIIGLAWILIALWLLKGGATRWQVFPPQLRWLLGVIALTTAWSALWISKLQGNSFVLSILFLVWIADTGAYFFGKRFGRCKLAPTISPGKSWEGAIGGAVSVILLSGIWVAFDLYTNNTGMGASIFTKMVLHSNALLMFLAVVFLTAVGIVGDLTESLMKRSVGLKDSSNVLPGHGGVLDRVDALLPVLPLALALSSLI